MQLCGLLVPSINQLHATTGLSFLGFKGLDSVTLILLLNSNNGMVSHIQQL